MEESFAGKVIVKVKEVPVFEYKCIAPAVMTSFPGNEADAQFASKEVELDKLKYGCAYTGKHDHGDLPLQNRSSQHEQTLYFLQEARRVVGEHFTGMKKE